MKYEFIIESFGSCQFVITNKMFAKYIVLFAKVCLLGFLQDVTMAAVLPVDVSGEDNVLLGSPTTLTCSYETSDSLFSLNWAFGQESGGTVIQIATYLEGVGVEYPNSTFQTPDYTMTVTPGTNGGSSQLAIKAVQEHDNSFICTASAGDNFGTGIKPITVNVKPSLVVVSDGSTPYGNKAKVIMDNISTFQCTATGQNPSATIKWTLDGNTRTDWPSGTDSSTVFLTPVWGQHGQIVVCTASVPADVSGKKRSTELDVQVPPSMSKVTLYDDNNLNGYNSPNDITNVLFGTNLHDLTCFVEGTRPEAIVTWKLDNQPQTDGIKTTPTANTGEPLWTDTSSVFSLTPNDCSTFNMKTVKCQTSILEAPGQQIEKAVMLKLNKIPDMPQLSYDRLIDGEGSREIQCTAANGYPDAGLVWWYKDGNKLLESTPSFNTDDSICKADMTSKLPYTPQKADNGLDVKCEFHHSSSKTEFPSARISLDVKFCALTITGPQINECSRTLTAGKQSPTFSCESGSSNPATLLNWFLDGTEQFNTDTPHHQTGQYNGNVTTSQFNLGLLEKQHNGKILQCRGVNPEITCDEIKSDPCLLNVLYPPEISHLNTDQSTIQEGGTVNITCVSKGNPEPKVSMLRNSEILVGDFGNGRGEVFISEINNTHAGEYQCMATNDIGYTAKFINVTVLYSPIITNKDQNYIGANQGSTAIVLCKSQSNPVSNIVWYHPDGQELLHGDDRIAIEEQNIGGNAVEGYSVESTLTIQNVQADFDYGKYNCVATNDFGKDSFLIKLDGTRVPDSVTNVRLTNAHVSSLAVEWSPGYNGGEDQNYIVAYRTHLHGTWKEETASLPKYNIMDLEPGTQYDIHIFGNNSVGRSKEPGAAIFTTRRIPDSPMSVEIVESTTVSLEVRWVPGFDGGDPQWFLFDYAIEGSEFQGVLTNVSDSRNTNQHIITGLDSGTLYKVVIYSKNRNGVNETGISTTGQTLLVSEPGSGGLSDNTLYAIVGAIIGTFLLLIIIVLSVYLFKGSKSPKKVTQLPLQETSENTYGTEPSNAANETLPAPVYAKVNKGQTNDAAAPLYAKVNKPQVGECSNATEKPAYDNDNFQDDKDDSATYEDVSNTRDAVSTSQNAESGKTVSDEGLIYQEVGHFKSHPTGAPPIQTEESTEYAALDFNRMQSGKK